MRKSLIITGLAGLLLASPSFGEKIGERESKVSSSGIDKHKFMDYVDDKHPTLGMYLHAFDDLFDKLEIRLSKDSKIYISGNLDEEMVGIFYKTKF